MRTFALLILVEFTSSHQRCSIKRAVFTNSMLLQFQFTVKKWLSLIIIKIVNKYFDSESCWFYIGNKNVFFQNNFSPIYKHLLGIFQTWPFTVNQQNSTVFFCHSQLSLICFIYLSLPNLYFHIITSMKMFLKVVNEVNFRVLTQT